MVIKTGLWPEDDYVSVKVPVFSFAKLRRVDPTLAPEMKSTGEVMGRDATYAKALYKGLIGAGMKIPATGAIIATVADKDKEEAVEILARLLRARLQNHRNRRHGGLRWKQAGMHVTTSEQTERRLAEHPGSDPRRAKRISSSTH